MSKLGVSSLSEALRIAFAADVDQAAENVEFARALGAIGLDGVWRPDRPQGLSVATT
jgi:hypothetical protein